MKVSKKVESERDAALKKVVSRRRALDSTEKTVLDTAVINVKQILERKQASKKILKKKDAEPKVVEQSLKFVTEEKPKKYRLNRGIIYLGHIPHGFYEEEMKDYFSQFGKVTRTRISRSKKTGNSRGYGFVEFANDDVARVAAQTMNNYLMCGRLLKATHITPEKKHPRFFTKQNWSKDKYPTLMNRKKTVNMMNAKISDKQHAKHVKKTVKRLRTLEINLSKHGINLKFKPTGTQES